MYSHRLSSEPGPHLHGTCPTQRRASIQHARKQASGPLPTAHCHRMTPAPWSCGTNRKQTVGGTVCGEPEFCGVVGHAHWVFGVLAEQLTGHSWGQGSHSGAHKQKATRGGKFVTRGKLRLCRVAMGDGGVGSPGCSEAWWGEAVADVGAGRRGRRGLACRAQPHTTFHQGWNSATQPGPQGMSSSVPGHTYTSLRPHLRQNITAYHPHPPMGHGSGM